MKIMDEKILDELFNTLKEFFKKFMETLEWKSFFNNSVSFFTDNRNDNYINNQLKSLFSHSNISELVNIMKNNNGFTFKNALELKLRKIIDIFDATEDDKNIFVYKFMDCLLKYLEEKKPELFMQYITKETYELVSEEIKLIEQNKTICSDIKAYITSEKKVLTLYDVDNVLINSSSLKINLSFFESDDKEFKLNFKNYLDNNKNINIVASSRDEALMTILYELKLNKKNALIIYDFDDWMKIYNSYSNNDLVYIPFFHEEMIPAIPNGINIFIYDIMHPCILSNEIKINRRNLNFVAEKLIGFQMSHSDVDKLLNDTHGFFVPMAKRLFDNSQILRNYEFDLCDLKAVICAVLVGQWNDNEGDKSIISLISGMDYSKFISIIKKYSIGLNPLIFNYKTYGENKYSITSLEDALVQFHFFINSDIWENYLDVIDLVLFDVDKNYNGNNYFNLVDKSSISTILKKGIYNVLLYIMCCLDDNEKQNDIKKLFIRYFDKIKSIDEWISLSKYAIYISEIVPNEFLTMIENSFNNMDNNGLAEVFKIRTNTNAESYYVNYIWALEELLLQKEYVYRALDVLFLLDDLQVDYQISNSPKNTLRNIFCAWINLTCIEGSEKIEILKKYININHKNVCYALENLPNKNMTVVPLCKPKYRPIQINENVLFKDEVDTYIGYLNLCVDVSLINHSIILQLIDEIDSYGIDIILDFFGTINSMTETFNDEEKYQLKYKLRCVISNHRFYKNAEWAMPEEKLKLFLEAMNKITFSNQIYDYKYLFEKSHDFPLLNPVPFESDDYSIVNAKNDKLIEEEILNNISKFINNKLNVFELINIIDSKETNVGQYIYLFDGSYFLKETVHKIAKYQKNTRVLELYSWNIVRFDIADFKLLVQELISISYDMDSLIEIIRQYPVDDDYILFIDSLTSDEIKKGLWSNSLRISSKFSSYTTIFDRIKRFGNADTYINTLYNIKSLLVGEELYNFLLDILEFKDVVSRHRQYELSAILNQIRMQVTLSDEQIEKLASVELKYWYLFEWKQMCFLQNYMVKHPNLYSEIIRTIYTNDENEFCKEHDDYSHILFNLYYKMEFCPGNIDGIVDENVFNQWVSDFKNELINQKQSKLFSSCMGRLCAYSPYNKDGMPLADCVRKFIEKNFNNHLASAFATAEYNKRGVFTYSYGNEEYEISLRYKKYADYFRKDYPKCAYLFDVISHDFKVQSEQEKTRGLYEK